ncbi:putative intracellular transport protein [Rhizoclosmatium globosum]|uniref:Putative intracellular transport protein n=1 Tax=Rhizoclosmatium globosum TaxID=329046 RepID=A0A1Y2CZ97_9FUNG|nr:putative intracellular transport protein [Rhizoclosmatium globosum]|eukprot:ORY52382.1 putative intracellular transport protein [Rhizoclosmatium globosum]
MAEQSVLLATAGYDHTIRFWEALSGICVRTIQHTESRQLVSLSYRLKWIPLANASLSFKPTHSGNPHVRLYDAQTNNGNPITSFEGHTGNVTALGFQSAGRWLVTGSEDGSIKIWDVRSPNVQRDYQLKAPVTDVIIHPNQGELVSCDQNGTIKEDVPVRSVSMAIDGSILVAANNKGNVYVWRTKNKGDFTDLEAVKQVQAHKTYITNAYLVFHRSRFELEKTLKGHSRWVWDVAFSADSAYLVTGSSDNSARLWDLSTSETIRHYNGHQKAVVCVALHDISI